MWRIKDRPGLFVISNGLTVGEQVMPVSGHGCRPRISDTYGDASAMQLEFAYDALLRWPASNRTNVSTSLKVRRVSCNVCCFRCNALAAVGHLQRRARLACCVCPSTARSSDRTVRMCADRYGPSASLRRCLQPRTVETAECARSADVTHGRILSDGPVVSGGLSPENIAARRSDAWAL